MSSNDRLVGLLVDLKRMGRTERGWVLAQLEDEERGQVERLLEQSNRKPPKFDALARLSPWLADALADARKADDATVAKRMTHATRAALIDAERLLDTSAKPAADSRSWYARLLKRSHGG